MAEPNIPFMSDRRIVIGISVLVVVIFVFLFFGLRSCSPTDSGNTIIYSNLDLADAAKVVTRLKELKIPYVLKEKGTAVAVPKSQAAQARLGLAEKNLPSGGVVGWEIFNETKMGATDFDRRIQLIRAISGELSRTIRRIDGVSDARVQIVLPETRLFEIAKAPVTASVLLRLNPGSKLKGGQIRGIIHLVASSVENLKTENVTVVDDSGKILSAFAVPALPKFPSKAVKAEVVKPAVTIAATKPAKIKMLSAAEKDILRLKAKEEYERQLSAKAQKLLNQFMSPNIAIAQVNVEFGDDKSSSKFYTRLKINSSSGEVTARVKKITIIVLIDEKIALTSKQKKNIYSTLALAVPYNRNRGDRITIKKVPFRKAVVSKKKIDKDFNGKMLGIKKEEEKPNYTYWGAGAIVVLVLLVIIIRRRRAQKEEISVEEAAITETAPSAEEAGDAVNQIKDLADQDPERIANMLKDWLMEEKGQ